MKKSILKELIKTELGEISTSGGAGAYMTPFAFKKKKTIRKSLQEASYRKFKGKISNTTHNSKIRKAIKEIKSGIKEINSLVDFSTRLKEEMGGDKNWAIVKEKIDVLVSELNTTHSKLKNLYK